MQLTQNQIDLFEAIEKSSVNDVKSLINNGVDIINITDSAYYTHIHSAIFSGNLEIVKLLINVIPNPGTVLDWNLHFAAMLGKKDIVKYLLGKGYNPNMPDCKGNTPIHFAAMSGNIRAIDIYYPTYYPKLDLETDSVNQEVYCDIVKLLIEKDPDNSSNNLNLWACRPIDCAIGSDNLEIVKLLFFNAKFDVKSSPVPLIHVSAFSSMKMLKFFIESGEDINELNELGETVLHNAVIINTNKDILELLLKNMNSEAINKADNFGRTALHNAAGNGHLEIVELLLEKGANVNQADKHGQSALHLFVKNHKYEMVKLLIESDKCDLSGMTDVLSIYFKDDPEMLIKISQQKPGIVNNYVDRIEIEQEKDSFNDSMSQKNQDTTHIIDETLMGNQNDDYDFS